MSPRAWRYASAWVPPMARQRRPKAAGRFGGVVAVPLVSAQRNRQCEESAGFIERCAQRRRTGTVADEIEKIAMLPCRRVGPFPGNARAGEADEQRAPLGAVEVANDPVSSLLAAAWQVTAAHRFGARAERCCDAGRVHGAAPAEKARPAVWGAEHDIETSGDLSVDDRDAFPVPAILRRSRRAGALDGAAARAKRGRAAGRSAVGSGTAAKRMGRRGEAPTQGQGGLRLRLGC